MPKVRRQNVPGIAPKTAPESSSPPATLVQHRIEKTPVYLHAHARHRLNVFPNFPVRGSSPRQARARPPRVRACPLLKVTTLLRNLIRKRRLRSAPAWPRLARELDLVSPSRPD